MATATTAAADIPRNEEFNPPEYCSSRSIAKKAPIKRNNSHIRDFLKNLPTESVKPSDLIRSYINKGGSASEEAWTDGFSRAQWTKTF